MRHFQRRLRRAAASALLAGIACGFANADELISLHRPLRPAPFGFRNGELRLIRQEGAPEATESTQPLDTESLQPADLGDLLSSRLAIDSPFGDAISRLDALEQSSTPALEAVPTADRELLGVSDVGQLLDSSNSIQTVSAQQRSPVAFDPRVRGYHIGQIHTQANGEFWMPVRNDLDSMLSRIDPGLIESLVVTPGPYGLRYGPGFAFIDVVTMETPRYDCPESHNRFGITSRFNGGQLYGYDTYYGGGSDYGFIFSYGNRTGADYLSGGDERIPSSYHAQNELLQFGFDVTDESRVELRYNRLDQTDTENALQLFDINYLVTDSLSGSYIVNDPCGGEFRTDGWFNRTRFAGDTTRDGKQGTIDQPTKLVVERIRRALDATSGVNNPLNVPPSSTFLGNTNGDLTSAGGRAVRTYGDDDEAQFRLGTDLRYLEQQTFERFNYSTPALGPLTAETNQPRSYSFNPGAFTEASTPWREAQTLTVGARVDWVSMSAQRTGGLPDGWRGAAGNSSLTNNPADFPQNDVLYAFYATDDIELSKNWNAKLGFGHAQRAPTLTERYADGVFLGIFQSGFSRIVGNPNLDKERNWQMDAGLTADYDVWKGRVSVFHSWILDYVTYEVNPVLDPTSAYLLHTVNTPHATLTGGEMYGEVNLTEMVTMFGSVQYVEGRDQTLGAPLSGIYPLTGRAGFQFRDTDAEQKWGSEFGALMVDAQDRLGTLRLAGMTGAQTIETFTPGFATFYIRGFYNFTKNCSLTGGIDNLMNRNYYEHLNLRLGSDNPGNTPNAVVNRTVSRVYSPGITPYLAFEWTY